MLLEGIVRTFQLFLAPTIITYLCILGENSPRVAIGALPDEILLKIFHFCRPAAVESYVRPKPWPMIWHKLVHVCRRWRYLMFSSPLSLDLRLSCTNGTAVKEMLDVWPPLPIEIYSSIIGDNEMAALEHHDRIREINFRLADLQYERLGTVLQKSFPLLTTFRLTTYLYGHVKVLPDTFLGGSAPRLRSLSLDGPTFPTLPQFLLSCNDLSDLRLLQMADIGYISPEAMVTGLSTLTRLTHLNIEFRQSGMIRRPPPLTRVLLPALTQLKFCGTNEYLEDLLAPIDAPQLEDVTIVFDQHVSDIRQVISHSRTLGPFDCADVTFMRYSVCIQLSQSKGTGPYKPFDLRITADAPGQQVSSMAQICTQSSSLLSGVTKLRIGSDMVFSELDDSDLEDLMDNPEWLVIFHPFTAVRMLRFFGKIQRYIVSSLRLGGHTGQSVTEVLPELQQLYLYQRDWRDELEEEETIQLFVAARQQSDHPVTVHRLPSNEEYK
jgi:F-box-like